MIFEKEGIIYNIENDAILAKARTISGKDIHYYMDNLIRKEIILTRQYDAEDNYSDKDILDEFADNFKEFFDFKSSLDKKKVVFLDYIENVSDVKYSAAEIVKYLKEKYDAIILYSVIDAEEYWANSGFVDFYNSYYIYIK